MASSDTDFDDERKPETAIWPAKPEVLIFESEGPINLRFCPWEIDESVPEVFHQPSTTGNTRRNRKYLYR